MIVPMKKVSLILLAAQKKEALKKLRKLGLLHIEVNEGSGERLDELREWISLLESAIFSVGKRKKGETREADADEAMAVAREILSLAEQKRAWRMEQIALHAELERLKPWGDVSPEAVKDLAEKGMELLLYDLPRGEYEALGERLKTVRLCGDRSSIKCLAVRPKGEDELIASLSSYRLSLPEQSTDEMRRRLAELDRQLDDADERVAFYAGYVESMKHAIKVFEKEMEFEIYATGMADEMLPKKDNGGVSVAHFKGYIEAEKLDRLKLAAKENSWGLAVDDPCEEDNVPTKLKNNKLVSLIYPLTDFLGTVPGYFEYDISSWFLLFILIFFGIIFGDGGYGVLICTVAAIPILKALITKKAVSPMMLLIGLFGLSTILWGTLTCTWFGLSPEQLPQWLKALSVPVISNVYADKIWSLPWTPDGVGLTTAQNLQIVCFSLALIQLAVAHIKGAVRNRGSVKLLGDIGSILQLLGIYYLVLSLVVNSEVFRFGLVIGGVSVGTVVILLIALGFVLSFVFSNYEGSLVKAILSSLKNIVSVLLGVVNVFSDIVSYIRLWAVGLAGAAISATVNELAGPLLGHFMFMLVAVFLLVFGHALNMTLNVLSVIVHGIRLNTLEFSSHLNMSWSGHKFKPFEE